MRRKFNTGDTVLAIGKTKGNYSYDVFLKESPLGLGTICICDEERYESEVFVVSLLNTRSLMWSFDEKDLLLINKVEDEKT